MKILHTADIHLGVKNSKLPKDKQALLQDEMIYNTRIFFDMAQKEKYDAILICGDLFHSKTISLKLKKVFFSGVQDFKNPVIYINGNHDENFLFNLEKPSNFIYLDNNRPTFSYQNYEFYSKFANLENLDHQKTNILLLHGSIENTQDNDYFEIQKYLNLGFDYIALGHVHQFKEYSINKDKLAYSGCLFSCGFDEGGEKGFVSLQFLDKQSALSFVPFPARKFATCNVDITNLLSSKEILEKVQQQLEKEGITVNDLVRVVLKGSISEDCEKSVPFIESRLNTYFYIEIKDKTTFKIDVEKIKKEKLSFKYEFISLIEQSGLDQQTKNIICQLGLEALKGEDVNI